MNSNNFSDIDNAADKNLNELQTETKTNQKFVSKDKNSSDLWEDLQLSETDVAWLVGLLEGEGSFLMDDRPKTFYNDSTSPPTPVLKISMTDKDVIERVAKMFNRKSFEATKKTAGNKTEYIFSCQARPPLLYLLPRLLPYFGERRAARVQKCIDVLEDWKTWYLEGGRSKASSKAAKIGAAKRANK